MQGLNLDYYYGNESEQFSFFRIPKVLFTDERFKNISAEAKVLYGMLLDRMGLSRANGWLDKENRVYIIFTIDEIQDNLNCSKQKAVNLMAELDDEKGIGLIQKKRQGLGKPNIIFVKNFIYKKAESAENTGEFQKSKNHTSRSLKTRIQEVKKIDFKEYENHTSLGLDNRLQEVSKLECNNTNIINTDFNHIQSNLNDGGDREEEINTSNKFEEILKTHIEYDLIYAPNHLLKNDVDNIIAIMSDILNTPENTGVKVNGVSLPGSIVKKRFMEIKAMHIDYILDSLHENPSDIKNIRAYLVTTIFNAPATISQYYRTKVNHDLYGSR